MYNRLIKYFEKSSTIFYQQFGIVPVIPQAMPFFCW